MGPSIDFLFRERTKQKQLSGKLIFLNWILSNKQMECLCCQ
jgi:hypothetical protein